MRSVDEKSLARVRSDGGKAPSCGGNLSRNHQTRCPNSESVRQVLAALSVLATIRDSFAPFLRAATRKFSTRGSVVYHDNASRFVFCAMHRCKSRESPARPWPPQRIWRALALLSFWNAWHWTGHATSSSLPEYARRLVRLFIFFPLVQYRPDFLPPRYNAECLLCCLPNSNESFPKSSKLRKGTWALQSKCRPSFNDEMLTRTLLQAALQQASWSHSGSSVADSHTVHEKVKTLSCVYNVAGNQVLVSYACFFVVLCATVG